MRRTMMMSEGLLLLMFTCLVQSQSTTPSTIPTVAAACQGIRGKADIAFLLDGSGSVSAVDFRRMKTFVKHLIGQLIPSDAHFAIVQYSSATSIHYFFNTFQTTGNWQNQVDRISKRGGGTNTAAGMQKVVDAVFLSSRGWRSHVKNILIVITDGQSADSRNFPAVGRSADKKTIIRYAVGVGNAFNTPSARAELKSIASGPLVTHAFQVTNFTALDRIRYVLQDSICRNDPVGPTPVLECERDEMLVGLLLAELEAAGLDPSSAHLVDHRCSVKRHGNGTVWYQVERTEGTCGNTLRTNGSHAIYSNTLFVYSNVTVGANGTLVQPLTIPFSCHYSLETEASLDVAIRPILVGGGLSGSGPKARASMSLFRNDSYSSAYPAGRVTLPLGSVLYVGVAVEEIEKKHFVVVLENCYATHSPNPQDRMRYYLIQRKCPSDRRQVAVSESGSSLQARFSALLFLFQGDYRDVFLHCSLSLCDQQSSSCRPNCSGRSRRSVSESLLLNPVTIGPITWDQTLE